MKKALLGLAALASLALACNGSDDPGDPSNRSTEFPAGRVVKNEPARGKYEICVLAAYNDKGYKKGEVACKGERTAEEARLCPVGAYYPECRN